MRICGVDEVGRGPLAGPVCAAAVIFPTEYRNPDIKDSKKLSAKKREYLVEEIYRNAIGWSIVSVGHHRISRLNILGATKEAMRLAVLRAGPVDLVRIDGNTRINVPYPQETHVKGDTKFIEIAAASIIAKVWRDKLMEILSKRHPAYGFELHAGYPTEMHRNAIKACGPSKVHRRTFHGVKEYLCIDFQKDKGLPADWEKDSSRLFLGGLPGRADS